MKDRTTAAAVAEPGEDVWAELGEEWEAFIGELEAEEEGHRGD